MKKQIVALGLAVALAASATFTGCGIVKVVKIGEEGKTGLRKRFSIRRHVE